MSERVRVGTVEEFEEDEPVLVEVDGREICVVNDGEAIHALGNRCPHRTGPLHKGEVAPEVSEDMGNARSGERPELVYQDDKVLVCPWHGWEYYLESGDHAGDDSVGVPVYDVSVDGDEVYLDL